MSDRKPMHRYVTDDRDYRNPDELQITQGGNGDYYISVAPKDGRTMRGVRFCTRGGCASRNPRLLKAVQEMFQALGGWDDDNSDPPLEEEPTP